MASHKFCGKQNSTEFVENALSINSSKNTTVENNFPQSLWKAGFQHLSENLCPTLYNFQVQLMFGDVMMHHLIMTYKYW